HDKTRRGSIAVVKRRCSRPVVADPERRLAETVTPRVDEVRVLMVGDTGQVGNEVVNKKCVGDGALGGERPDNNRGGGAKQCELFGNSRSGHITQDDSGLVRCMSCPKCKNAATKMLRRARIYIRSQPRLRAVTSISIFTAASMSAAEIIVAAGRISPKYRRSTGQHGLKSSTSGRM